MNRRRGSVKRCRREVILEREKGDVKDGIVLNF